MIIPDPMRLIASLRNIIRYRDIQKCTIIHSIRHDVKDAFEKLNQTILPTPDKMKLLNTGLMTKKCFEALVSLNRKKIQNCLTRKSGISW